LMNVHDCFLVALKCNNARIRHDVCYREKKQNELFEVGVIPKTDHLLANKRARNIIRF